MGAISLLDYYLGLSLLGPFRLDYEKEEETVARQIFAIIKEQIDQLAHTEGLFIREIVNQCLFNSDMSRTEIIETIINFYQNKLIFPNDSSRILPPFYLSEIEKDESEEEVEKPETPEEMSILFEEPSKIASEKPVTAWIIDLITSIQKSTVPDQLKEDILSRDIIFESQLQLRNNALTSNIYTESELENWLFSLSENGYSLKNSLKNPLNGVKFILSSTKNEFILSIAFSGENKFVCVMGLLS
ncbi:MAG: hypothetical protein ACXADW_16985 [Candidatus Hodarchaeales archaeon]|jgi:hypothetical protein